MRIAFSGAACTGKTTTIEAFLRKWPSYKLIQSDYRRLIKKTNGHSSKATKKNQEQILDIMLLESIGYTPHDRVVFDRCPLDNVIYSLWCYDKGIKGFTEKFIKESIEKVRESMRHLDIIFICTRDMMPPIVSNGVRDTNPVYVDEINTLFKTALKQTEKGVEYSPFFPKDDSPGLINIHGTTEERNAQIALYVTDDGNAFGEDQSLINVDELNKMYSLLKEQQGTLEDEQKSQLSILNLDKLK